jgi:uncharacterized membrane protein (UPF0127 family)
VHRAPMARMVLGAALLIGGLSAACKSDGQKVGSAPARANAPATAVVDTGTRKLTFRIELAMTPEEQARGLMYRSRLETDAGMLFVARQPRPQSFWMKNTLIPLDMIFIGGDRRIVGIVENAEPETETARFVGVPSQYVLEIGGGLSSRLGIRAGQRVDFEGVPTP